MLRLENKNKTASLVFYNVYRELNTCAKKKLKIWRKAIKINIRLTRVNESTLRFSSLVQELIKIMHY